MHRKPLTLILPVLVSFIFASAAHADAVDDLVRQRLRERNIPAAAITVIQNGRVVKQKAYGLASVEFQVPATVDTVFEVGSVSKQMTAAAIMMLVQDEKISLDTKISEYLSGTPDAWKDITVRHLLTHSSGIKSYSSLDGFELSNRHTVAEFIKKLAEYPLEFEPGEKTAYNNSGFNLLAYIVEAVSGKPFMEFMRSRIFIPLGMINTIERDPQYVVMKRAVGYEWRGSRLAGRDGNLTNLMGAGSIISTVADLAKWNAALDGDKFLSAKSKAEMWRRFVLNDGTETQYGFGWRISDVRGHKLIGHTGQTAGFGAANFRYVDDGLTVIVLTNLGELGMGGMIASLIAKTYIPDISLRKMPLIRDEDEKFSKNIFDVVRARIANEPDASTMSEDLYKRITTPRVRRENERIAGFGEIQEFDLVSLEDVENKRIYLYRANTGKRLFLWRIETDAMKKITEMALVEEE